MNVSTVNCWYKGLGVEGCDPYQTWGFSFDEIMPGQSREVTF